MAAHPLDVHARGIGSTSSTYHSVPIRRATAAASVSTGTGVGVPAGASGSSSTATILSNNAPTLIMPHEFKLPKYLHHSAFRERFSIGSSASALPAGAGAGTGKGKERERESFFHHSFEGTGSQPARALGGGDGGAGAAQSNQAQSIPLPSRLDPDQCCKRLVITNGYTLHFLPERDESGKEKVNTADPGKDAAAVRADVPIPPQAGVYYYEVKIVSKGLRGYISVGFTTRAVNLERLPGWNPESYGYHGDDGKAFACTGMGEPYGPRFGTGDIIGCGVDYGRRRAFFVKNGKFLGYVFDLGRALSFGEKGGAGGAGGGGSGLAGRGTTKADRATSAGAEPLRFYPTVGLQTAGETVYVNFGQDEFRFDIAGFVRKRKQEQTDATLSTPIPKSLLHALAPPPPSALSRLALSPDAASSSTAAGIAKAGQPAEYEDHQLRQALAELAAGYLNHQGYSDTARALRKARAHEARSWNALLAPQHPPPTTGSTDPAGAAALPPTSGTGTDSATVTTTASLPAKKEKGKSGSSGGKGGKSLKAVALKSALRSTLASPGPSSGSAPSPPSPGGRPGARPDEDAEMDAPDPDPASDSASGSASASAASATPARTGASTPASASAPAYAGGSGSGTSRPRSVSRAQPQLVDDDMQADTGDEQSARPKEEKHELGGTVDVAEQGDDDDDEEYRDALVRKRICSAIRAGDTESALVELGDRYPGVLGLVGGKSTAEEPYSQGNVGGGAGPGQEILLFRLRCQKFVEMILRCVEDGTSEEGDDEDMDERGGGDGEGYDDDDGDLRMDEEDEQVASALIPAASKAYAARSAAVSKSPATPAPTVPTTAATMTTTPTTTMTMEDVLAYGAELNALYSTAPIANPLRTPGEGLDMAVASMHLQLIFSLVAYADPCSLPGELGRACSQATRESLAEDVNSAMLVSKGRPARPVLETLLRQAEAVRVELGERFADGRAALLGDVLS